MCRGVNTLTIPRVADRAVTMLIIMMCMSEPTEMQARSHAGLGCRVRLGGVGP
jgi:hypothetical protein